MENSEGTKSIWNGNRTEGYMWVTQGEGSKSYLPVSYNQTSSFSFQNDCEYCQYHIQSQYKKLSSKRADLQSTFSGGRIPKKLGRKNPSLKERLCQDGFHYGGVSSTAYAASV